MRQLVTCALLLLLAGCQETKKPVRTPVPPSPRVQAPATPSTPPAAPADPYPECATIRSWLAKNTSDPAKLQVVEWKRDVVDVPTPNYTRGTVRVEVKCREANQFGALHLKWRLFVFTPDGKPRF